MLLTIKMLVICAGKHTQIWSFYPSDLFIFHCIVANYTTIKNFCKFYARFFILL